MFGMPSAQGSGGGNLFQMKCGRLNLAGTTLTADTRKGLLILRKAEDGLMHLIWKDRTAGTVVDTTHAIGIVIGIATRRPSRLGPTGGSDRR